MPLVQPAGTATQQRLSVLRLRDTCASRRRLRPDCLQVQVDEIYGRDEAVKAIQEAMDMYKDQYLPKRAR